jgi:hypothetical protein
MPAVEVFKTDVLKVETASQLLSELRALFPHGKFNFALDDCDKILRAEGDSIDFHEVARHLHGKGHQCVALE